VAQAPKCGRRIFKSATDSDQNASELARGEVLPIR
jgi:hypothetical protein